MPDWAAWAGEGAAARIVTAVRVARTGKAASAAE